MTPRCPHVLLNQPLYTTAAPCQQKHRVPNADPSSHQNPSTKGPRHPRGAKGTHGANPTGTGAVGGLGHPQPIAGTVSPPNPPAAPHSPHLDVAQASLPASSCSPRGLPERPELRARCAGHPGTRRAPRGAEATPRPGAAGGRTPGQSRVHPTHPRRRFPAEAQTSPWDRQPPRDPRGAASPPPRSRIHARIPSGARCSPYGAPLLEPPVPSRARRCRWAGLGLPVMPVRGAWWKSWGRPGARLAGRQRRPMGSAEHDVTTLITAWLGLTKRTMRLPSAPLPRR